MKRVLRNFLSLLLLVGALSLSSFAQAQSGWENKPYQQWTMEDLEKILSDSPWAQTREKGLVVMNSGSSDFALSLPASPERVTLRLRSGLPIRVALMRLRQMKSKYDKMSEKEKADFDARTKTLLECPACADNYVVALSPPPGESKGVPTIFRNMSLAAARQSVEISNDAGEKRELVHFEPPKTPGGEVTFFFARLNQKGEPLLTPTSKKLFITFDTKIFGDHPSLVRRFEFDVQKMLIKGQVSF
ncbi:MAG TPA: hypothetical protein VGB73_14210 [Pyrinomonadaceae bacterium]|jgi:hypothetical protein